MKISIFGKPLEYTLKLSGLWPDYFNILGVILMGSAIFTIVPFQIYDVYREFDNTLVMLDSLSHILAIALLYSKFFVIWCNRRYYLNHPLLVYFVMAVYYCRVFVNLLREMAYDYETEANLEQWSKLITTSHRFTRFDYALYFGTSSMYYIQIALTYSDIPVEDREMMLRAYYPFDYKSSPAYEIMTFIQIVQGLAMCSIQALSESLIVALILHICGHINLLFEKIDKFSESCKNNHGNVSLAPVIKQHHRILDLFKKVETVYSYASFIQIFLSTFMICCVAFIVLTVTDDALIMIKYTMLCLTITWQGYSFCFFGQRLINKSEKISNKIYSTNWYDAKPKDVRAIAYIISKAQKPLTLNAGKFTSLSAQTFTIMMKTSFSYVSVLRASVT